MPLKVKSPSKVERDWSFSRAVRDGDMIYLSNTAGVDYVTRNIPGDAEGQTRQVFANVEAALAAAGGTLDDSLRAIVSYSDMADIDAIMAVFVEKFAGIEPAFTLLQQSFSNPALKVEIELTARAGSGMARAQTLRL